MSESQRRLWLTVRRALLMICKAIEVECGADNSREIRTVMR